MCTKDCYRALQTWLRATLGHKVKSLDGGLSNAIPLVQVRGNLYSHDILKWVSILHERRLAGTPAQKRRRCLANEGFRIEGRAKK